MTTTRLPATPESVGRSTRMIFLSLPIGVLLFSIVCLVLARNGTIPLNPGMLDERMLLMLWIAVALGSAMGAVLVWRNLIEPIVNDRTIDGAPAADPARASRLTTFLIICWAMIEAPSLLGLVLFVQTGDWTLFMLGVGYALFGYSLTAPRLAWFRAEGARS